MLRKPELSRLTGLAWPATVSTLSFTLMEVIDCAMLGAVGVDSLAGAALASTLLWLAMAFPVHMLRALAPVTATFAWTPEGGPAQARRSLGRLTLLAAALLAVPATGVTLAGFVAVGRIGIEADLAAATRTYLSWRLPFVPADLLFVGGWALLEGVRNTRAPMIAGMAANAANLLLNLFLIPRYGVVGAAVATGLSTLAGLALIVRAALGEPGLRPLHGTGAEEPPARPAPAARPLRDRTGIPPAVTARFLQMGWHMGVAGLFELSGALVLGLIVAGFGSVQTAVHGVLFRLVALGTATAGGLAVAVQVSVAQAMGHGKERAARTAVRTGCVLQLLSGSLLALCLLAGGRRLLACFSPDPSVLAAGADLLLLCTALLWIEGLLAVTSSVVEGAGRTRSLFSATVLFDLGAAGALAAAGPVVGVEACYALWLVRTAAKTAYLSVFVRDLTLPEPRADGALDHAFRTDHARPNPAGPRSRPLHGQRDRHRFLARPYSLPLPDE